MMLSQGTAALTPSEVVHYLDRYIVGQSKAKRAVAVALRNRIRRRRLPPELAKEIAPKNILMVGPTGVGKTEIARRLADLVQAPFVKVEATKFTEVGYVGRDVESMVRDLVECAVQMVKSRMIEGVQESAREAAKERLIDYLVPLKKSSGGIPTFLSYLKGVQDDQDDQGSQDAEEVKAKASTRQKMISLLESGKLDQREVEIDVQEASPALPMGGDLGGMAINLGEVLGGMLPKRTKRRRMKVQDAMRVLQAEEAEKLVDMEAATREALEKAQEEGILFIDEIDKIASHSGIHGADVSREGVQRDLLPVVEGCAVQTKYGQIRTDHILFIAAGAFHQSKPSDLVPELQGRLPIRVELDPLTQKDLERILTEPEHSLLRQASALLGTEGVELEFSPDAVEEIAALAQRMNADMENIGARRLHTMMEQLLEDLSFSAPQRSGQRVLIDRAFVKERLDSLVGDQDLRRYLL